MKKRYLFLLRATYYILFITAWFLLSASPSYAIKITPTDAPSPTKAQNESIANQLNQFKDKIASRVAQLKLVEKRGVIGTVTEVNGTQLSLISIDGNKKFIDVDEITKFSSPSAKDSFGISDMKKGTTVSVLGLYNKESQRILARFIDVIFLPITVTGQVTDKDTRAYTLTVALENKQQETIDIESTTKTTAYTKDAGSTRSGFSKITAGDRIFAIGYPNKTDSNRITAANIVIFPDLSGGISVSSITQTPTNTPIPSPTINRKK